MNYRVNTAALLSILALCSAAPAGANDKTESVAKVYSMYSCTLRPFNRSYVDVAVREKRARKKVHNRCEKKEGKMSIFCAEDKAECTPVKVKVWE